MLIFGSGLYGSVLGLADNLIMLCCPHASCIWRIAYDCIIVASKQQIDGTCFYFCSCVS